jgi:hypothetical protein
MIRALSSFARSNFSNFSLSRSLLPSLNQPALHRSPLLILRNCAYRAPIPPPLLPPTVPAAGSPGFVGSDAGVAASSSNTSPPIPTARSAPSVNVTAAAPELLLVPLPPSELVRCSEWLLRGRSAERMRRSREASTSGLSSSMTRPLRLDCGGVR